MAIEEQPDKPASVELRSDALLKNLYQKPRYEWSRKKQLTVAAIAAAVVLVAGGGVWLLMRTGGQAGVSDSGANRGSFGNLPASGDRAPEATPAASTTVSGLSGRRCEEANRRPVGAMLSSDQITRPVSGFAQADWVWELPVLVNDVTRLLAVYQCGRPGEIGSVRSVRHDYLLLADGMDVVTGHWGGSYHALNRIRVGEFPTIDALGNPFNAYFRKSHIRAPYNGFTSYDRLWAALQGLKHRTTTNFVGYQFKDDIEASGRPAGGTLTIAWPGAFRVHYEYDPATNRYPRFWGGTKQLDGEDQSPVAPSSVAIIRATNGPMTGPGGYNDVGIEGQGEAVVYQDGQEIKGSWKKNPKDPKDPMQFLNADGQPIIFTRGQVWVMAVEPHIAVNWERQ